MAELLIIIEREFRERVQTRSFVVGTLAFPVFLIAILLLPTLGGSSSGERRLVVVDGAPAGVADVFVQAMQSPRAEAAGAAAGAPAGAGEAEAPPGYDIQRVPLASADFDRLNRRITGKELDAYVVLGPATVDSGRVELRARNITNRLLLRDVRAAATAAVQTRRLGSAGLDPSVVGQLMHPVTVRTARITEAGESAGNAESTFFVAYILAFMAYFVIAMYGHAVMRSVIQEKTTRISEILVSTVRAGRLMGGKIAGVSAAALLQLAVWAAIIMLVTSQSDLLREQFGVSASTMDAVRLPGGIVAALLAFFVLGFLVYASLFAGLGASMSTEQEAQPYQMMLMLPLFLPLLFLGAITNEPDGAIATFLGLFPLTAPVAMPMRLAAAPANWSQVGVALAIMVLTAALIAWVAGKIYRAGILATGKKATLHELVRWIRAA